MIGKKFRHIEREKTLLVFLVIFMLAPKITVFSMFRAEDIVVLLVLPLVLLGAKFDRANVPKFMYWYFAYISVAIFSAILNYENGFGNAALHVTRQIQYLIWFVIGTRLATGVSNKSFLTALSFIALVLIIWWIGEISGIIPKIGRFSGVLGRVSLNTSGPYEISVVVVLLMLFVRNKLLLVGLVCILLTTQARVTLVAAILGYLIYKGRRDWKVVLVLGIAASVVLYALPDLFQSSRLAESLTPIEMWQRFSTALQTSPLITSLGDYRYFGYDIIWTSVEGASNASYEIRIIRWSLILKSLGNDFGHFLFGWGPGAWGLAVDSHYVRYLGEVGVIGTLCVLMFFYKSLRSVTVSNNYKFAILLLVLCSVFIDVMTSSKIMSLLWVILGYTYTYSRKMSYRLSE